MFVGLALKPWAAVMNVSIGKYNEFGRAGAKPMWQGESRFWTDLVKSKSKNNSKTWAITDHFGLLSQPTQQMTEGTWGGPFGQFMFMFMTGSEDLIQRTSFISQLTDDQWNSFKVDKDTGEIVVIKGMEGHFQSIETGTETTPSAKEMKDNVYSVQGRGYTVLDQRLIQNYYISDSLLQFKRWFPTFVMDRVANEGVNRFGKRTVGSLNITGTFLKDVFHDGELGDLRKRFGDLKQFEKDAFNKAIRRSGVMAVLLLGIIAFSGFGEDDDDESGILAEMWSLFGDMMLLVNVQKLTHMASAPMLQTFENIASGFAKLFTGATYQRKTLRAEAGDPKFKGDFLRAVPSFLREVLAPKKN